MEENSTSTELKSEGSRFQQEHELKQAELELKREEIKAKIETERRNAWFSSPLIAVIASAILVNGVGTALQGYWNTQLERQKFESSLIQKALENPNKDDAANSLRFLVDAGLIQSSYKSRITELAKSPTNLPTIGELGTANQPHILNNPVESTTVAGGARCRNPPVSATLNYWPISFKDPAEMCHDFAPIDVRNVNGGRYSSNQDEWEAGRTVRSGDELYVLIFINNGAADSDAKGNNNKALITRNTAHNVTLTTEINAQPSSVHYINVQFAGDNTNTVNSRFRITTVDNGRLAVVSGSGEMLDSTGTKTLKSNLEVGNNTTAVGDIKPLFQDARFIRFRVRVVS